MLSSLRWMPFVSAGGWIPVLASCHCTLQSCIDFALCNFTVTHRFVREIWSVHLMRAGMHANRAVHGRIFVFAFGIWYVREENPFHNLHTIICVCLANTACFAWASDTVTVILTFLQHVINMPRMLCVVCVCVFWYLLTPSPALTSKSSHLTPVVPLSTCQQCKLIPVQIHTNTLSVSMPLFWFILANKLPSSDVHKVAGRVQTWHMDSTALARGTNEVKQIYTVP